MTFGKSSCSCCNVGSDRSKRAFYIRLLPLGKYMVLCDRCATHRNSVAPEETTVWDLVVHAYRTGALSAQFIVRTTEVATQRILRQVRDVALVRLGKMRTLAQEMSRDWARWAVSLRERLWSGR